MRWDKKYPEWYPPLLSRCSRSRPLAPSSLRTLRHRRRRRCCLRVITILRLYTSTSSIAGTSMNISTNGSSSSTSDSADPLGYRVRIPGLPPSCHWSAPLPSTLCQPPPAANLCHTRPLPIPLCVFVLRQLSPLSSLSPPGVDFAENMNIIRCLRIRRSAFPRTRVPNGKHGARRNARE